MRLSRYTHFTDVKDGAVVASLLTRRVLRLPRNTARALAEIPRDSPWQKLDEVAPGSKFELITGLYFVPDHFDEWAYIRDRHANAVTDKSQLNIVIAPTMGCNMACHYCFEAHEPGEFSEPHSRELTKLIRSKLIDFEELHLQWFGGEPLLAMHTIEKMSGSLSQMARAAGKRFSAEIITNGVLMDAAVAKRLVELGVSRAQVTFDGHRALHDRVRRMPARASSFDRIVANVRKAPRDLAITARIHVAQYTQAGCYTLLDELAQRDMQSHFATIYFAPLFSYQPKRGEHGFHSDERRFLTAESFADLQSNLLARAKKLGFSLGDPLQAGYDICTAMQESSIVVAANGSISKCYLEVGDQSLAIGDLDGHANPNIASRWAEFEFGHAPECRTCNVAPVCLGGCPKESMTGADLSVTCSPLRYNLSERLVLAHEPRCGDRNPDFLICSSFDD